MTIQTSSTGQQYRIYCDMDEKLVSYDTANPADGDGPDYAQCFYACDADSTCESFTVYGGCYLKHSSGQLIEALGPIFGQKMETKVSSAAPASSPYPACPGANTTIQTASDGTQYKIYCDIDSDYGSYTSVHFEEDNDYTQCLSACSSNASCVSFTAYQDLCYLKNMPGSLVESRGVTIAEKLGTASNSTAPTTTSSGSASFSSGTSSSASSYTSTSSSAAASASNSSAGASSSSSTDQGSSHHGLSTGAIVGLAIGVAAFVLLLTGALLFRRYRSHRSRVNGMVAGKPAQRQDSGMGYQTSSVSPNSATQQTFTSMTSVNNGGPHTAFAHMQSPNSTVLPNTASELSDDQRIHELHADTKLGV